MSFVARGPQQGFVSVAPRALLVCVLCVLGVIVTLMILDRLLVVAGVLPGETAQDPAAAAQMRASIDFWKRTQFGLLGLVALAILYFLLGSRHNLPALGVSDAVWPVLTGAVLWCLPVINLIFATLLLREAWRASDPFRAQSLFVNWRQSPSTGLASIWLVVTLAALALTFLPLLAVVPQGRGLLAPAVVGSVAEVLWLMSYSSIALVVSGISRRQDLRAARADVAALPAWARG